MSLDIEHVADFFLEQILVRRCEGVASHSERLRGKICPKKRQQADEYYNENSSIRSNDTFGIMITFAPAMHSSAVLQVSGLCVSFPPRAVLRGVDLCVEAGQVLCVGGGSGSGKSTLLRAILGLVEGQGEVCVCGRRLNEESVWWVRRQVAYVPQELSLPCGSVEEMVRLPFTLRANRALQPSRGELLAEWERLGLGNELLGKRAAEVSGGQRQRMMLATAGLLHKPLLLADEPTSALDGVNAGIVVDYFHYLAARGTAVLAASHASALLSLPGTVMLEME